MKHDFGYMIKEYAVKFILKPNASRVMGDNGRPLPGVAVAPINKDGIVLPLSNRDIQCATNGTYTKQDKKLIVSEPLKEKDVITYKGLDYTIQEADDWDDYSDFYVYLCRRGGK